MAFYERLVRLHERMVLGVAYRLLGRMEDAQDAAQEVFLKLFQKSGQIQGDPKPWLYRVTVNVCNDWYRKRTVVAEPNEHAADPSDETRAYAPLAVTHNENMTRYTSITFDEAISKNLQVMDATAFALCRDQNLPIKVFSIFKQGALKRVVLGEDEGTLVHV